MKQLCNTKMLKPQGGSLNTWLHRKTKHSPSRYFIHIGLEVEVPI